MWDGTWTIGTAYQVHTSTCNLSMVEARLATKDIDGECANPADRITSLLK